MAKNARINPYLALFITFFVDFSPDFRSGALLVGQHPGILGQAPSAKDGQQNLRGVGHILRPLKSKICSAS